MFSKNSPIGIFDSGVGGLTILSSIKKLLPNEQFIYFADSGYAPYGTKLKKTVQERAFKIAQFLRSKNVKLIVVACNTATVTSLDCLRKEIKIPIIGVVPVVKTAVSLTRSKRVAILATPATCKSAYLKRLVQNFANGVDVKIIGKAGLENLIEKGEIDSLETKKALEKCLVPLIKCHVDVIALGCTHYPFLKNQMQKIVGPDIQIIDSGDAVARQIKRVLSSENRLSSAKFGKDWYYTSGENVFLDKVIFNLIKMRVKTIKTSI